MKYKKLIKGVEVPVLGIGTWGMGGGLERDTTGDEEDIKAIRYALEQGMTHIDTAELYGDGHAEEIVGEAIKGWERDKIFITTKVWSNHLRYRDLVNAAKRSLKRLGIDYIDLYLIHWPNPEVPLKETMDAMNCLLEEKIVRFIGVSNFSLPLLKEAESYTENKIVANQVEYSLLEREIEGTLLPYCQKSEIMVIAYKPLARGRLARPGFPVLDRMSKKYGKTQAQVALNWLISKPSVVAIPKSSSIEHLRENIGSIGWEMDEGDIREIEEAFSNL